jgi:hypothetical protein
MNSASVKETGGKPDRKSYPLPYGLRNLHRNLKSENSQDYAQKPQQNCTYVHDFGISTGRKNVSNTVTQ